ncbi:MULTISPECIES: glycosyltransferase family protein [Microbulbifer]|uniref:Uncharacterized protein n=1 Tax=Microbulbifer celer TaxID=435905 RepID=A0ABW3UCX9_9GAMM|nr:MULTISPECIES: hypothetical protein [Microbulbifer]UFN57456.1 hypothetical protein LPW13_18100 [Microbulbifer celer]
MNLSVIMFTYLAPGWLGKVLKGSDASAWKTDILRVNGLDEPMAWGGLDREFGVRQINAGVKPRPRFLYLSRAL